MIRFERELIDVPLRRADGATSSVRLELRRDPLSGDQGRITARRPIRRPSGDAAALPPLPPPDGCPLCQANIDRLTPELDPRVFSQPRLRRGEATIFPNLFPYGRWSAVLPFTHEHFVPIEGYTTAQFADALCLAGEYARALQREDPSLHYVAVTQNHLPTSGATIIHPHLQVQVDPRPSNWFSRAERGIARHYDETGRSFFPDLVAAEQEHGERYLHQRDDLHVLTPFVPRGFHELWLLLPERYGPEDLDEGVAGLLAEELCAVLGFYHFMGGNAYNLALTTTRGLTRDLPLLARVVVRGRFAPYARSDVSFHEKLLEETALSFPPEETAKRYKAFLADQ
jgi:UDPglucose--hexose-1-phosphate uridylyltransferase